MWAGHTNHNFNRFVRVGGDVQIDRFARLIVTNDPKVDDMHTRKDALVFGDLNHT
jgi:hypothetical protein